VFYKLVIVLHADELLDLFAVYSMEIVRQIMLNAFADFVWCSVFATELIAVCESVANFGCRCVHLFFYIASSFGCWINDVLCPSFDCGFLPPRHQGRMKKQ